MSKIVKNTTFPNLLDLIAPHSCRGCGQIGNALCDRCKNHILSIHQSFCPNCKSFTSNGKCSHCPNLPPTYIIGERSDLLGKIIHDYKYNSVRSLARPLADLMNTILPCTDAPSVIVPLPTIDRHIRERGFDHTWLIAKLLAKLRGNHCQPKHLLLRATNTTQVGTNRSLRISQAQNAYRLNPKIAIDLNFTYILLDDVWTTGASMQNSIKILQQAGVNQTIVALLSLSRIS